MGLPQIVFEFIKKAVSSIKRSQQGVVALILADDSAEETTYTYSKEAEVDIEDWNAKNLGYIKLAFKGAPKAVIVERVSPENTTYDNALARLKIKKWNYLSIPGLGENAADKFKDWIIAQRATQKQFKAVLPKCAANNEGIINFTTDDIASGSEKYTTAEYCARIAGALASVPLNRSCTYMVLEDVTSITETESPDDDIDKGQLIIINDGEKFKLGTGVNSLVTISGNKTEDMKKIKIIEGMDLMREDICNSFENNFVGTGNGYDDKINFINAIEEYSKELQKKGVLNREYPCSYQLDIEETTSYLREKGVDTSEMSDSEILRYDTGDNVFIEADVKFLDAMENLQFKVYI